MAKISSDVLHKLDTIIKELTIIQADLVKHANKPEVVRTLARKMKALL